MLHPIVAVRPLLGLFDRLLRRRLAGHRLGIHVDQDVVGHRRGLAVLVVERASRGQPFAWPTPLVGLRDRRYGEALLRYGRSP